MLAEAYRVLKVGGKAAFSVWGSKENGSFFTVAPGVMKKHGVELHPVRSSWHLNDREALVKRVESAGFKNVVAWNQYVPFREFTEDTYNNFIRLYFRTKLPSTMEESKKDEILEEIVAELKKVGSVEHRPIGFNAMIVTGTK